LVGRHGLGRSPRHPHLGLELADERRGRRADDLCLRGSARDILKLHDVGPMCDAVAMKGQQKPKQLAKKAPQKTLKEQRAAKKAKKKDY